MFDDEVTIGESLGNEQLKEGPPHEALISNDHVGMEIELEAANQVLVRKFWTNHQDGSLRNNGVEFVFSKPLNGKDVVDALAEISSACAVSLQLGRGPNVSDRTSVHLHVNVQDLTRNELSKMILLYSIFEIPFFKTFGSTRMQKHFCIPYNDLVELMGAPRWLHQGFDTFQANVNNPNIGRYCAFNLRSIFKFGTVEFRHHPGCWDFNQLLLFTNSCLAFKRAGKSNIDLKETFFRHSERGFEEAARLVFPRNVAEEMFKTYGGDMAAFSSDVIHGIRCAQHATLPFIRI